MRLPIFGMVCAVAAISIACDSQARARVRDVTVPQGTALSIKLDTALASDISHANDPVRGTLTESVTISDDVIWPAGAIVTGVVTGAQPSGDVKGRASLGVRFTDVQAGEASATIAAAYSREAPGTKAKDAEKIGIGAGAGAIVGAIVGGKKGAAVGTAVGGGAGTGVVLTTSGDEVRWPAGATITVRLDRPADVKVPLRDKR